ncbi:hypothetical protein JQU17_03580 [Ponticoccus sp. SC2-23]|uniref:hypothetical protein n=1 Tax=Alexandriicola marinus TaxID=2081710 RepID=UPI000FDBA205|nr:hypothetical protein [Alexandriicola marinus]MBM1219267.1 hypothetical protein [Ponticoccus sp. SC6-9]MBM1223661.1 hypothetical protein [Ponticoccus sp. SC6-15]MBM1229080.1 hypothetical protein [Ponticoccus sp. SC6-38]MBM1232627.1 hypothetical protein [Ponticoccus sp. SC6-45]MBM1237423.1 hypothetical protein [Ponticoccus sp. SC6-49]MBM1241638.1 hypothetical protein [Ponticoccus sp. SC2-64]MBM1246151.1 hypothetical protein [Ponticoccus sp. SC6-42]MBM1250629.1 hypothetical protein [Pontico
MMTILWALIVLLLIVITISLLIVYLRQRDQTRREAIEALAARRGWSLMITSQSLGRPSILRLASRSGPAWQAETKRFEARSGVKAENITEYHSTATSWADNLMIICHRPGDSAGEAGGATSASNTGAIDQDEVRALVGQDIGDSIPPLQVWPAHERMIVYASADPSFRVDLGDLAKVFLDWEPLKAGPRGQIVVILGNSGLRVRLRHSVNGADGLERFVDYSTGLYRLFSRP